MSKGELRQRLQSINPLTSVNEIMLLREALGNLNMALGVDDEAMALLRLARDKGVQ